MSGTERLQMHFCPTCGEKLPTDIPAKFCLFCGACLPILVDTKSEAAKMPIETRPSPRMKRQEEPILLPAVEVGGGELRYSVIIKKVIDPVRLTEALMPYLARGEKAIRMAVDMTPTVLIYKGKKAEVERILPVLASERACYTVVEGDFEREAPVQRVVPGFLMLSPGVQDTLENAPSSLWIGEHATVVVPSVCFEKMTGCLVVTNLHVYFLPNVSREPDEKYRMWPLAEIAKQDQWEECDWYHVDFFLRNNNNLCFSFKERDLAYRFKRAVGEAI